ncbi:MAG TPA: diguanylate cyclase [Myxococcota bacterium]|nr:diguanylate cyclase [Myxococcota bacterium]
MSSADSKRRVLCVDDSRLTREQVRDALGHRVELECVDSAEAAIAALERAPADLVLSDLQMGGMSGLVLLGRARRIAPGVPFVLLTAHASVDSAIEALRHGATDYLQKPIQPEHLVSVVERILAHQNLLRDNERLRGAVRTLESCRTLMHCLDPGEVYAVALDLLLPALGRDLGLALFRRSAMPGSDGIAFRGFDEVAATELQRRVAQAKADSSLFAAREPHTARGGPIGAALEELGVGGGPALLVPLHGAEREEGLLWVPEQGRPSTASDLEQARLIAAHAELALANAERYHQAKEKAFIDDVTEVYNARYLLQATEHEIHRAARSGKELSVLFLDLDRFKRVNDQYGHLVGSNVLRRLSEVLLDCVRQVDTLARYGGDEFTILLVDTGLKGGVQVAERIRRTVAETLFEGGGGAPIRLTISIGVATFPDHSRDREGLLDAADKAMYRAKSKGRNCVCSAAELGS